MTQRVPGFITPARTSKPRRHGLTMVIDGGLPIEMLEAALKDFHHWIDYLKLGWTTAAMDPDLARRKIAMVRRIDPTIKVYLGGTFLEHMAMNHNLMDGIDFCRSLHTDCIEVSDGSVEYDLGDKERLIKRLVGEGWEVLAEVGAKDEARTSRLGSRDWAEGFESAFAAGATHVIAETRQSGTGGLVDRSGRPDPNIVEAIVAALDSDQLSRVMWEAPTTKIQAALVDRFNSANLNFGNIAPASVLDVETVRCSARSDTMPKGARAIYNI